MIISANVGENHSKMTLSENGIGDHQETGPISLFCDLQLESCPGADLQLTLTMDLSIASYMWQSTCQSQSSSLLDIVDFWAAAAAALAPNLSWSALGLTNQDLLLQFTALEPTEQVKQTVQVHRTLKLNVH